MAREKAALGSELERMRERTRQARETMAEKLFSREAIDTAMSAASAAGHAIARIEPEKPADLKDTAAAIAAADRLKAEGFEVKWEKRSRPEVGLEWWVLVVDWTGAGS